MIFQQPQSSLNPVWDVGRQIEEVLRIHRGMKGKAAEARALELLRMVGIPDPAPPARRPSRTRCPAAWPSA